MGDSIPEASRSGSALRSVSSAGPEAAAPRAGCAVRRAATGGPGEDRHLTRVGAQYAQGCWWGALPPTGCPAASERGFNVRTT